MSSSEEPPAPPSETCPAEPPPPRASLGGFSEHGDADTPPPAGRSRGNADADVPPPPADRSPIRPETAALAAAAATEADQACDSTAAFLADTAPRTPAQPKTKQSKALAAIASELVCSICCSVAARAVVANPCGHVFCGGCLERWLRRKRNCPNCQQRLDATAFVAVPALDHVVSALVDASPNLRRRDSIDRRRNRSPVPPTPPPPPSNGFVTAAELLRRSNGAVPPPPTPADTTSILGAVRALDPRSDIERAVEGLDGLALAGGRSDLERAVDRLNDLPRTSPARTPPVRARRGTGRVSLVERQRQHTAERLARRPPRAPVGAPYRASPRTPSAATPPGPRRWRNP